MSAFEGTSKESSGSLEGMVVQGEEDTARDTISTRASDDFPDADVPPLPPRGAAHMPIRIVKPDPAPAEAVVSPSPPVFERGEAMAVAADDEAVGSLGLGLTGCQVCPRPFNTTSTVIAASTVANPDMEQIFFTLVPPLLMSPHVRLC